MERGMIVVAGHICLDIIPGIPASAGGLETLLVPGKLVDVGAAVVSTGGAVSNTGLALHRLGLRVALMGQVGNDPFGQLILGLLRTWGQELADGMIVSATDQSSYTVVINPPNVDRIFLHCPGANDTFTADRLDYETVARAGLFHFGYPPLMRSMYENEGREVVEMFRRVKALGVTTSLDMALPDPSAPAGKVNWRRIIERAMPYVDLFLPSLDEILFMLGRREAGSQMDTAGEVASDLIGLGAAMVMIKLGDRGACLRTTADVNRLAAMGACAPSGRTAWAGKVLYSPCFEVDAVGTTGAGDCTIAGFLAGFVKGLGPEDALTAAVATGACNVEAADATSGIPSWERLQARISAGWKKRPPS